MQSRGVGMQHVPSLGSTTAKVSLLFLPSTPPEISSIKNFFKLQSRTMNQQPGLWPGDGRMLTNFLDSLPSPIALKSSTASAVLLKRWILCSLTLLSALLRRWTIEKKSSDFVKLRSTQKKNPKKRNDDWQVGCTSWGIEFLVQVPVRE
jgi:hypothetical protein